MKTHETTTNVKAGGVTLKVKSETVQGDMESLLNREIPGNASNLQFNIAIPTSTLLSLAIACQKKAGSENAALNFTGLTIKTNSTSTPGNTLAVTPTNGIAWSAGDDPTTNPNPITTAVTTIYVSNTGTAAGILDIAALIDSSPGLTG